MTSVVAELTARGDEVFLIASGPDAEVARAAKHLELLTPKFAKTNPPGGLVVPLSWGAIVQVSAAMGQAGVAWCPGPRLGAWIHEQQTMRVTAARTSLRYSVPDGLTPYPWQVEGAGMIADLGRALITDEPGTGKTITTILGLVERDELGLPAFPAVIVTPASVVDPWVEAFKAWAPRLRTVAWRGTPAKRHALAGTADVYVVGYETMRTDTGTSRGHQQLILGVQPVSAVADECHLIKNPQAERSKAFRRLARQAAARDGAVVALSGTPITHSPADLWPTLVSLEPDAWPARERWVHRYCQTLQGDYKEEVLGLEPAREPEFRLTLLGQHRRVAKADVLTQLPPKVYSVRTVELPAKWRKAYDDMERQMLAELPNGEELSVMSVLAQLTRLSQLACAAADVSTTTELDSDGVEHVHTEVTLKAPSWKVDALLEILEERPGQPVVCFAPSRQLMAVAGQQAAAAGHRVGYVWGGQTQTERTATVAAFQAGELDLICVTTGAGGVGLTLTAARTCVFLQRPWSLVESIQAEDRCHRIGSEVHDSIEVIDVVASNTIDTRVRSVLRERAGQLADLVQDPRLVSQLLGGADKNQPGAVNGVLCPPKDDSRPRSFPREVVPAAPGPSAPPWDEEPCAAIGRGPEDHDHTCSGHHTPAAPQLHHCPSCNRYWLPTGADEESAA